MTGLGVSGLGHTGRGHYAVYCLVFTITNRYLSIRASSIDLTIVLRPSSSGDIKLWMIKSVASVVKGEYPDYNRIIRTLLQFISRC